MLITKESLFVALFVIYVEKFKVLNLLLGEAEHNRAFA